MRKFLLYLGSYYSWSYDSRSGLQKERLTRSYRVFTTTPHIEDDLSSKMIQMIDRSYSLHRFQIFYNL